MEFQKDKQFEVLLTLLAENLAYQKNLVELAVTFLCQGDKEATALRLNELSQKALKDKAGVIHAIYTEYGDIGDLLNP